MPFRACFQNFLFYTCRFYMVAPLPTPCQSLKNRLDKKKLKFLLEDKLPYFNKNKHEFVFHNSAFIGLLISVSDSTDQLGLEDPF